VSEKNTFLTEKQITVLKLRAKGMTQVEIARELNTTKANICAIESSARKNIEKAKKTLELFKSLNAPIRIEIKEDTDLYEIPGIIYREADKYDKWIPYGGPSLLSLIVEGAKKKIRERRVLEKIEIAITEDGKVMIDPVY